LQFFREYSGYTGWGIKSIPIKDSNISARCRPKELKFLPEIEAYLKFFFIGETWTNHSSYVVRPTSIRIFTCFGLSKMLLDDLYAFLSLFQGNNMRKSKESLLCG